jgi:hypothetical protein
MDVKFEKSLLDNRSLGDTYKQAATINIEWIGYNL